jgi:amino acid transporter
MEKHSGPLEGTAKTTEPAEPDGDADGSFKLSFWQLLAYSFGGMIGSGWLLGSYNSAQIAGSLAWVSWMLGGVAMLIIGIVMMELGRRLGRDGGLVWWPFYSGGPIVAMVVAAAIWIFYALNPASEAAAAVQFASHWLPWLYEHRNHHDHLTWPGVGVSALVVVLLTRLSMLGLRLITKITLLAGIFKVAVPLMVLALLVRSGIGSPAHAIPGPAKPEGILTAITSGGVIYTYIGFQAPVDFGGRARRPTRDIPWAVITPIIFGLIFFTLLQVLSTHDGVLGTGWYGIHYDSPYARLAAGVAGWGLLLGWLARIDTIVSPIGSGLVFTTALANTIDNLSSQRLITGIIPARARNPVPRQEREHLVPRRVLAINLVISLLFLPFLPDWRSLVNESSVITVFVYAVPSISLAALGASLPQVAAGVVDKNTPPSRVISRYLAPLSFMLMTLILYWADFGVLALGTALTLAGAAILLVFFRPGFWRPHRDRTAQSPLRQEWLDSRTPAIALASYLCGLVFLCWLRERTRHTVPAVTGLVWGDFLALALGFFAFRSLVASSAKYMTLHPPRKGPTAEPPEPDQRPGAPEGGLPTAPSPATT